MKVLNLLGLMFALSFGTFAAVQADANSSCCQVGDKTTCCIKDGKMCCKQ